MIKAIIFDLDDTLIDEYKYTFSAFNEISYKLSNDFKLSKNQIFNDLVQLYEESKKQVFNRFYDSKNHTISENKLKELIFLYRSHFPNNYSLEKKVLKELKRLKNRGIRLGIITDGFKESQQNKIKAAHLDKLFDCIIITDEMGREYWKPHLASYQKIQSFFDLPFKEMVYVGDNIKKDFIAPQKLGMSCIFYKRSHPLAVNNDDLELSNDLFTVNSKKELFDRINNLI